VREASFAGLKTVVFDVDGTLYKQGPLRRAMAMRLLRAYAFRPIRGLRTLRILSAYRQAQEHLRDAPASVDLADAQIRVACERTRIERSLVAECVARWMEHEPLTCLGRFVWPGLVDFVTACKARGLRLAALSDYPADAKLEALGLTGVFEVVLCAQSPVIGVFKPHPRGLQVALERLGTPASQSLYIGDRAEVDAAAAAAAGMPCAIVTQRRTASSQRSWIEVSDYAELHKMVLRS